MAGDPWQFDSFHAPLLNSPEFGAERCRHAPPEQLRLHQRSNCAHCASGTQANTKMTTVYQKVTGM
jgi:hypothetical protein